MAGVSIKVDGRFKKRLQVVFANYTAEVGILVDKPHKLPLTVQSARKRAWKKDMSLSVAEAKKAGALKTYAGGPARKTGRKTEGTLSSVSEDLRKNTGINIFTQPFRMKQNKEILKFTKEFVGYFLRGGASIKRVENLLQAIVRNPILRGDYGKNKPATAKAKGFNRFMIDTSQLFQGITARVVKRGGSGV